MSDLNSDFQTEIPKNKLIRFGINVDGSAYIFHNFFVLLITTRVQ